MDIEIKDVCLKKFYLNVIFISKVFNNIKIFFINKLEHSSVNNEKCSKFILYFELLWILYYITKKIDYFILFRNDSIETELADLNCIFNLSENKVLSLLIWFIALLKS